MPLPLSVAIVCKNAAPTIGRTLASVQGLAAEIVVLDSGSTDETVPLLQAAGARVIQGPWQGFMRTKNQVLAACTQPWVLCLDADESLEPALAASIRAALTRDDPALDGYLINRKVWYRGRFLHHAWQPERRMFLVRAGKAQWTGLDPHTCTAFVSPSSRAGTLAGDLRHDSFDSFEAQLRKQVGYGRVMAEVLVAGGARGSYLAMTFSPLGAFLKQIVLKQAFLDGWPGWLAAAATAQQALVKHAMIIELARGKNQDADKRG